MKTNASRSRQFFRTFGQRARLWYLAHHDVARFSRSAALSLFDDRYEQVVSRIMYNVHAIEKGLARAEDFQPGFGRKALSDLNDALVVYRSAGHDPEGFAYRQGVSILHRYREAHDKRDHDVGVLDEVADRAFLDVLADHGCAGTKVVRRADKERNHEKNFFELARGRCSVRQFSGRPIDAEKVMAAVRTAEKTPSVCNRQGWRVYWVEDKQLAAQVLAHQRGFRHHTMPEVLLTITVSTATYLSPVERNQAFVDGGLFSMSVLYGLEHVGLAAVPLNAMMHHRDHLAVRQLLAIDDSEVIAMFIAVGDLPRETVVPVSDRKPAASFVRRRGPARQPDESSPA